MTYERISKGVVKRTNQRVVGLFIDGVNLDRATRRLNRKVDLAALVRGVCAGKEPTVARYYTLVPFEDDSRHRAFLDAVQRAGLEIVVKRLPPKGITRQASIDVEMAADIAAFALGHDNFVPADRYLPRYEEDLAHEQGPAEPTDDAEQAASDGSDGGGQPAKKAGTQAPPNVQRIVTVVCPSRELAYPIGLAHDLGADTVSADFGKLNPRDSLKSAAKWIDLSDSETIWRA